MNPRDARQQPAWEPLLQFLKRHFNLAASDRLPEPYHEISLEQALEMFEDLDPGTCQRIMRQLRDVKAPREMILAALASTFQDLQEEEIVEVEDEGDAADNGRPQ